jgi:hypothetical protein
MRDYGVRAGMAERSVVEEAHFDQGLLSDGLNIATARADLSSISLLFLVVVDRG